MAAMTSQGIIDMLHFFAVLHLHPTYLLPAPPTDTYTPLHDPLELDKAPTYQPLLL